MILFKEIGFKLGIPNPELLTHIKKVSLSLSKSSQLVNVNVFVIREQIKYTFSRSFFLFWFNLIILLHAWKLI